MKEVVEFTSKSALEAGYRTIDLDSMLFVCGGKFIRGDVLFEMLDKYLDTKEQLPCDSPAHPAHS